MLVIKSAHRWRNHEILVKGKWTGGMFVYLIAGMEFDKQCVAVIAYRFNCT